MKAPLPILCVGFSSGEDTRFLRGRGVLKHGVLGLAVLLAFAERATAQDEGKPAASEAAPKAGAAGLVFEKDLLPVLRMKCLKCHGETVRKAELNLATQGGIRKGSSSGEIVAAGKPEESLLLQVVRDGLMPPDKEDVPLTAAEMDLLERWIKTGARFAKSESATTPAVTERDVSQILLLRCAVCHNGRFKEGGLDLSSRSTMLTGGKSGPAIDLKMPAESLILKKIRAGEMPPLRRLASASIKVIEKAEVDKVAQWIALGAPATEREEAASGDDPEVAAADREFWSFQPPRPQAIPAVRAAERVRNPIDSFLLAKLEEAGLTYAPETDRRTLIRRASFDLTGLPPSAREVEAFVNDRSPQAYENLIERLLASPRYGERWGRYWLDLAGYSDSDGVNEDDPIRPYAYRYRDYVIRSFNGDKPYNRFLLEQLAGDELADYEQASPLTEEIYNNLVATGFLRMGPDGTYNGLTNFVPDRLNVIASEIEVLTSGLMGLTVKCARCHSHKFDPIPHRDYYRLAAILKGAYDENDWLRPSKPSGEFPLRGLNYALPGEKEAWEAEQARLKQRIAEIEEKFETRKRELVTRQLETTLTHVQPLLRDDVKAAVLAPRDKRTEVQKYLFSKFEKLLQIDLEELQKLDADFGAFAKSSFTQAKELKDQQSPNEPHIQALWDRGQPTPTYVLRRGNYLSPGREVEPGIPEVLNDGKVRFSIQPPWPGARQTGRRLALARWLVDPGHPLTSRVMVNRIWKHHFANGIVRSLDNFGRTGQRPTHPELLDWLANEFTRQGWSQKSIHRLIMTSTAYRQSSQLEPVAVEGDPENRLLSRFPLRRLDAETLRDALLLVSGNLDETPFGPGEKVERREDGLVTSIGTDKGWRRSIYVLQRRSMTSTILEDFDLPQMSPNCVERTVATAAPQALHLLNNKWVHRLASTMADHVLRDSGSEPEAQIRRAYELALGRGPDRDELEVTSGSFDELQKKWRKQLEAEQAAAARASAETARDPQSLSADERVAREALTNLCHALLNSAAFLYVD